jgi:putative peptidoglycan lipid II flippase
VSEPELPAADARDTYARNTAVMTVGTTLSRFTGFLRIATQTAVLGVTLSAIADTYQTANTTPNILYELALGGILTSVFVPLFVGWMQLHGRDESWRVADRVLTLTAVGLSALALLGAIFAPWIIRLYNSAVTAPDRQQQIELGTFFLRWFMPQIVFYGIGAVAGGLLNANRRFAPPMFTPILNNLVVIATFGLYSWMLHGASPSVEHITTAQKLVLALGTTLGVVAMTVALWPSLRRLGYRWHLRFDWGHPALRRLGRLAGWVFVYVVANQVAYFIIIILCRHVEQGGITAYAAAFIVFSLPHAIFGVSIFTALLPGMSAQWAEGRPEGVRRLFSRGIRDTWVIILPSSAGLIALALPLCGLVFEHFHAGAADATLIAHTLQAFAVGLPFFSTFQLLTRTFYSMQDTRTPAVANVAAAVVNIAADLLFAIALGWGIPGMALGYSVSYLFGTVVLLAILHGRLRGLDGGRVLRTIGKAFVAAAISGGLAYGAVQLVDGTVAGTLGELVTVAAGVAVGLLAFVITALIVRIEEVEDIRGVLARRVRPDPR